MKKVNVGIVGCGNISGIYLKNLTGVFSNTNVYAVADLDEARAKEAAEKWGIPNVLTFEQMLKTEEIEIILNITTPQSHYEICKKSILAKKHTYVEKPLSLTLEEGLELVKLAKENGVMLGGAPDTFMGAGIQTCRKLIDDDYIGRPVAATAFLMCHGHEGWHPDPEFYYMKGGGPMLDMGPYYLTALVNLMGSVSEVCGLNSISFPTRTITSEKKYGKTFEVEVPTHVAGLLRFEGGAIGTIITSFDVWKSTLPRIEIYGTKGTMIVPDPNTFGGPVQISTLDGSGFKEIPLTHPYAENSRGIGVSDIARCIIDGANNNRASGEITSHVLEIMCAISKSDESKQYYKMQTRCGRPGAMSSEVIKGSIV
jgi:predicted dehydrogenase